MQPHLNSPALAPAGTHPSLAACCHDGPRGAGTGASGHGSRAIAHDRALTPAAERTARTVSSRARETAAKVSRAFDDDQQLAIKLNDAHSRILAASDLLCSGPPPGVLAAIYGDHRQSAALQAAAHIGSEVLSSMDPLRAVQDVRWQIHAAHNDYQTAAEDRRRLAADIGELIGDLVGALEATGWTEDEARHVDVHELARSGT
jgi:hypothetical protein